MSELMLIQETDNKPARGRKNVQKIELERRKEEMRVAVMNDLLEGRQVRIIGGTFCENIDKIIAGKVMEELGNVHITQLGCKNGDTIKIGQIISQNADSNRLIVFDVKVECSTEIYEITYFPKGKNGYLMRQLLCA